MNNQHRLITGYRDLSEGEIQLMNNVKSHGNDLAATIGHLRANPDVDQRWVSIAQTDLQRGIMALTRAIAKPDSF